MATWNQQSAPTARPVHLECSARWRPLQWQPTFLVVKISMIVCLVVVDSKSLSYVAYLQSAAGILADSLRFFFFNVLSCCTLLACLDCNIELSYRKGFFEHFKHRYCFVFCFFFLQISQRFVKILWDLIYLLHCMSGLVNQHNLRNV